MSGTSKDKKPTDLGLLGWNPVEGSGAANRTTVFSVLEGREVISPADRKKRKMLTDTSNLPKFDITNPKNAVPANQSIGATGNTPGGVVAKGLVSPQQQANAANYIQDPTSFAKKAEEQNKGILDTTKDFMANLFDSKDPEKEVLGENVWDASLNAVGWVYDTINQAGSWAQSAAPGGLDTFGWDQAGEISYGQAAVTANAKLTNEYGPLGAIYGAITNPLGMGGMVGAQVGSEFAKKDFDITNAEQRRKAFEDDALGKWVTGVPDAIFTVFADPAIFGGKVLKISRIKWVDRQVISKPQIDNLVKEIDTDVSNIVAGKEATSTPGSFIKWVMEKDPVTGERVRTASEIYEHPIVKNNPARDSFTYAFHAADDVEEAAAILKNAYGDIQSRDFLLNRRQDITAELVTARRNLLDARLRFDPKSAAKVINKVQKKFDSAHADWQTAKTELAAGNITDPNYVDELFQRFSSAKDNLDDVTNFNSRNPLLRPVTADEVRIAREAVSQLSERNKFLKKALDEEKRWGLQESNKGFAVGNRFGLAVERSRQARATATAEAKATPAAPWKHDDFYDANFGTRVMRLWRYAAFEKPAGYIITRGPGNLEQGREIQAVFNSIPIYKGAGIEKTINGVPVIIGGAKRREELFTKYLANAGSGVDAENSIAKYLDFLEKEIMNDISAYHGLTKSEAEAVLQKARLERSASLNQIKEQKFWIEKDGDKVITHKAPYIESQLQQGTYMLNFTKFNQMAGQWVATHGSNQSMRIHAIDKGNVLAEKTKNLYDGFNDFWRPAVLLRLGYTQRNVSEGLFRSSAFLSSVAPLGYAGKQIGYSVRNVTVARAHARDLARIESRASASGTSVAQTAMAGSERFKKWRVKQETLIGQFVAEQKAFAQQITDDIATHSLSGPEIDDALKSVKFVMNQADEADAKLLLLSTDDDAAFSYYRKQGAAKRRNWDNVSNVDGIAHREAFSNPEYADIAWMNMSADNTTKTTLSLRESAATNVFKAIQKKNFISVTPDMGDAYFDGVATMLRQFKNSEIGERILAGDTPADIAKWMRTDPVGKEIADFVNGKVTVGAKSKKNRGFDTQGFDGALGYVNTLVGRLESLAPNVALRDALRLSDVSGADVKRMLDTPAFRDQLQPAIGSVSEEIGSKKVREMWTTAAGKMFKILGTIPEDNLVRGPFYGRRYNDFVASAIKVTKAQSDSGFISAMDIDAIHRVAHRRALKDTKDWLYTMDRRTNLGHYGEVIFPFISATQNSATALGKLIWKDPSLPGMTAAIWNLPEKMDIEDDQGNVVIPLQLGFIPKSIRESLGLGDILNAKFSKQGLNSIFPESGYGFVPRMGPIAGIPASELMKNEWFGASLATPEWLSNVVGKSVGDEIWNNWRDYVYGEDRGASPEILSWNVVTPPVATKFIQMFQGMNSSAFAGVYNKMMQTEMLRMQAGERDAPPQPDELLDRTRKFFMLRALGNVVAFTPPQYGVTIDPLVDTRRMYDRLYGKDADKKFNDQYGNLMLMSSNVSTTKNVAGVLPTMDAVARAGKYSDLIQQLAPSVQQNLGVLGIILNGDIEAEYNPSALTWQSTHKIPGLNKTYRELLDPAQVATESQRTAGWIEFIKFSDQQQAILDQRGLDSLQSPGAEDLKENKRQFIDAAKNNPLYSGWYDDYINFGSTRVVDSVKTLEAALSNKAFMEDNHDDPIWAAAYQYVTYRTQVIDAIDAATSTDERKAIKEEWATFRTSLIHSNNKWGTIASRYLDGDDDPTAPSTQMSSMYDVYNQQSTGVVDPTNQVDSAGYLVPSSSSEGQ